MRVIWRKRRFRLPGAVLSGGVLDRGRSPDRLEASDDDRPGRSVDPTLPVTGTIGVESQRCRLSLKSDC